MSAWSAILDTLYSDSNFAATATLSIGSPSTEYSIAVVDETAGVEVDLGGIGVLTVRPAASIRKSDLDTLGLATADIENGTITIASVDWRIVAVMPLPVPTGDGEYRLFLEAI